MMLEPCLDSLVEELRRRPSGRFPQKAPKRPEPNSKFSSYLVLLIYVEYTLRVSWHIHVLPHP